MQKKKKSKHNTNTGNWTEDKQIRQFSPFQVTAGESEKENQKHTTETMQ